MKSELLLILTAFIWGCAFTAQSAAMDSIEPWTFLTLRSFIASLTLLVLLPLLKRVMNRSAHSYSQKRTVQGGIACGAVLCAASILQQYGIVSTTAGKAGFLTALYVILVPLFGVFLGRKTEKNVWIAALLALTGFWFLSVSQPEGLQKGDLLLVGSAVLFAIHILVIDSFSDADPVALSCIQFFVCGILSLLPMLAEQPSFSSIQKACFPILYAGILSSGAGYTLQIIGQKGVSPSVASILLSLESVFAALAGFVLLGERLNGREGIGCTLIFVSVILAQVQRKKPSRR